MANPPSLVRPPLGLPPVISCHTAGVSACLSTSETYLNTFQNRLAAEMKKEKPHVVHIAESRKTQKVTKQPKNKTIGLSGRFALQCVLCVAFGLTPTCSMDKDGFGTRYQFFFGKNSFLTKADLLPWRKMVLQPKTSVFHGGKTAFQTNTI